MMDTVITVAMLERAGVPAGTMLPGLAQAQVLGRVQVLPLPEKAPAVIVDSIHTPQVMAITLDVIQGFGEVITVVGCGGDRDPDRRPLMGRAAAECSDVLTIANDNSRAGDPARIRATMLVGIGEPHTRVIGAGGRSSAIEPAFATTGRDSVATIPGKGHGQGQQTGGRIVAFDDALVAFKTWRRVEGSSR